MCHQPIIHGEVHTNSAPAATHTENEDCAANKKAMETDALMEKWKNEKACFPTFPQALGKLFEFPTVPTASTAKSESEIRKKAGAINVTFVMS